MGNGSHPRVRSVVAILIAQAVYLIVGSISRNAEGELVVHRAIVVHTSGIASLVCAKNDTLHILVTETDVVTTLLVAADEAHLMLLGETGTKGGFLPVVRLCRNRQRLTTALIKTNLIVEFCPLLSIEVVKFPGCLAP